MSVSSGVETWEPDPDDLFEDPPLDIYLATAEEDAEYYYVLRATYNSRRQLADFAMMLFVRENGGEPIELARVDCRHGSVHVHYTRKGDVDTKRDLIRITQPSDIVDGHELALDVMDNAEEIRRRWNSGR